MKLGLVIGYWNNAGPPAGVLESVAEAERLGFDSMWTAEAYGSDALTPLAWWGANTSTIKLGTGIVQISARTPAATAMSAITLDHLSGGRLMLGLGASGPQVVEGWYGVPFPKPLARTREYVQVMRDIWRREGPVTNSGEHYPLPYPGGTGLGKPLKANMHPLRPEIPVFLGAEGPKNVALAAEIADGWLPIFFHVENAPAVYAEALSAAKPGFEIACPVTVVVDDDTQKAIEWV
jgi:F420-dependent oxidoreductase-like protein